MSPTVPEPRRLGGYRFGGPWLAAILGLLCFANSVFNGFTYDDSAIVRKNPRIRSLANFREIWLTDWWFERTDEEPVPNPARDRLYRPLTLFSFALNYAVHQARPLGYHIVNVLLHAIVCWLVWRFARRVFDDDAIATVAAVLFAVHPVHAEAVAGIVGRGEILATGFLLWGLLTLMPRGGLPDTRRALLAAPLFFAGLLAKETAVCFPLVAAVALHAAYRERDIAWRWWLRHAAVLLLPIVLYLGMRHVALEGRLIRGELNALLFNPLQEAGLPARVHGPFTILGHYLRLLLVPSRLSCDYGLAIFNPHSGPELMTVVGIVAAAALVLALIGYRRSSVVWRRLAILSALFLASYALISNTGLLIGVSLAERLMYWPSVPALLAAAVVVVGVWRAHSVPGGRLRELAPLLRVGGVLLVLAFGMRSVMRNMDWRDNETLFRTDLGIAADWSGEPSIPPQRQSAHLCTSLADISVWKAIRAAERGDRVTSARWTDRAERLLSNALRIRSRYPEALKHLGSVYVLRGDEQQALRYYESSLRLDPTDEITQRYVARLRGDDSRNAERAAELLRVVTENPDDIEARLEYGKILIALGRNPDALEQCEHAARIAPESVAALRAYGEALAVNMQRDRALEVLLQVLQRDPTDWQTHANVATLLETRDPEAALYHAQRALDLEPNNLQTQLGVAEALALNGRLHEALQRMWLIENNLPPDDPFRTLVADRIKELEAKLP